MGHRNIKDVKMLCDKGMAHDISIRPKDEKSFCSDFCKGKMNRSIIGKKSSTDVASLKVCEKMYADLTGKFSVQTPEGFKYALCVSDRRSHYQWIRLLRKKSDVQHKLIPLLRAILRRFGNSPRVLTTFNTDNGGGVLQSIP